MPITQRYLVFTGLVQQTIPMSDAKRQNRHEPIQQPADVQPSQPHRASRFVRGLGRVGLGAALTGAGVGHLTTLREEFQAQVPDWVPVDHDFVEVSLGTALVLAPRTVRPLVGTATAAFFVAVFPGNIAQYTEGTDAFGLATEHARLVRLFFQPVLIGWALWSTGAWSWLHNKIKRT